MSLPHDPQQWQQLLNAKNGQNPYEYQNGQDATIPPTELIPPPPPYTPLPEPYTPLPEPYMPVSMPEVTGFRAWSTKAKIATGSFAFVFLFFLCLLVLEIVPRTGSTNTYTTPINTPAPAVTLSVASPAVSNKALTATPKLTPTQPASTHKNPTAVQPNQPVPTPTPTQKPTPTATQPPTPTPTATQPPTPTPTIGA
jgi:hypothetical protein